MINVSKPFLPPKEEYISYVNSIWERNWLTNHGPLVKELELELQSILKTNNLAFVSNGTIAIQIAIKALELTGSIITTPFSYVATTSSIVWESCTPIFVDINPNTFNIDYTKIENSITKDTTGILATHVFGNPCDIEEIEKIAKKHNLKVIYDAAHAFGTTYNDVSILNYGDISCTSFHATKLFHTIEGGLITTINSTLLKKIKTLMNFGHVSHTDFDGVGINGKNSEFHAAMGLCNLKYIDAILESRKKQFLIYEDFLSNLDLRKQELNSKSNYNYSYYPIVFSNESQLIEVVSKLNANSIFPRRYFFPSLNTLNYVPKSECPNSVHLSSTVLCLPLYHDLTIEDQDLIASIIRSCL